MIDERLRLARAFGDAEYVQEELLDAAQVGLLIESQIEGENRPGALEAVAGKVQLVNGVDLNWSVS